MTRRFAPKPAPFPLILNVNNFSEISNCKPENFLNSPAPPHNCPRTHRAGNATAALPVRPVVVLQWRREHLADSTRILIVHGLGPDTATDMDCPRTWMQTVFGLDTVADQTRTDRSAEIGAAICPDRLRFHSDHFADTKTLSTQGVERAPCKTDR